ncbi:MAG: PspA/IM30 family protein, partial [Aquihabitans sp.]
MFKLLNRAWRYLTASLTGRFNEIADPKVQLEQAITEAQDQHRRLIEQAANVVANQKQTEMRLNRSMEEMGKLNGSAR